MDRYGSLVETAEKARNFIFTAVSSALQFDASVDYTAIKDLTKVMIPIALKIKLGISDDVDFGFYETSTMAHWPILNTILQDIWSPFEHEFGYQIAKREQHIIFGIFEGLLNRIQIEYSQLRIALIAIDGKLSTQQIKFNLQRYFSAYIERIDNKSLYELNAMSILNYDYYICSDYGKKMNIPYRPIFYADEGMKESMYVDAVRQVFFDAYHYDEKLPPIKISPLDAKLGFKQMPLSAIGHPSPASQSTVIDSVNKVTVYWDLNASEQDLTVYHFPEPELRSLSGNRFYVRIAVNIAGDQAKLKMLLNVVNQIAEDDQTLDRLVAVDRPTYANFFTHSYTGFS